MKKYLAVLIGFLVIVVMIWVVVFFIWLNSFAYKILTGDSGQKPPEQVVEPQTTNVFGVKIENDCYLKYQDFVKNYGADYSKCLQEFDFTKEQSCGGYDPNKQALSNNNVLVILDASGSMGQKIDAGIKMDIAKKAISRFLTSMPEGVNTGLLVYGGRGPGPESSPEVDKAVSCTDIQEVIKLGRNNSQNILSAINSIQTVGWTPIAASLDYATNILKSRNKADKNYLVLLTDGLESCDGDPKVAAENLNLEVPNLKFILIGIVNNQETRTALEQIARYGEGVSVWTENSASISKAFNNELLLIKKECLKSTLLKLYTGYKTTQFDNLECWLNSYKKESDDFDANVVKKSIENTKCNQPIADALRARHTDFWLKKGDLEKRQDAAYKKLEVDYNSQIKALESQVQNW